MIFQDEIRELRGARLAQQQLLKICRNDTALAEKVKGFANKLGLKEKADGDGGDWGWDGIGMG